MFKLKKQMTKLLLNGEEFSIRTSNEHVQDLVDAIITASKLLGYEVKFNKDKMGINCNIYAKEYLFYIQFLNQNNRIYQIFIGDRVKGDFNGDFRMKRNIAIEGSFNSVSYVKDEDITEPLINFMLLLSRFDYETGEFNRQEVV
jgi:hypothetical protein